MRNNKSIVIMKKTNSGGKKIINQNRVKTKSFVGGKKQTLNDKMIKNTPPKCF